MSAEDEEQDLDGPEDGSGGEEEEELDEQEEPQDGDGVYETLLNEGPQDSGGSGGHPDSCMPCTFYCFTRRGCNRGLECRFCHMTHQSKLQQRRQAWKKQQREKRKTIRERVAQEAVTRRPPSGKGGDAEFAGNAAMSAHPMASSSSGARSAPLGANASSSNAQNKSVAATSGDSVGLNTSPFSYHPSRAVFTIGQEVEMFPQFAAVPVQFRVSGSLPPGLVLDQASGVIRGSPTAACMQNSVVIEADLLGGVTVPATVEIEVVDFTRGGFVVGHISEYEPGKFMIFLYVSHETVEEEGRRASEHSGAKAHTGGGRGRLPTRRTGESDSGMDHRAKGAGRRSGDSPRSQFQQRHFQQQQQAMQLQQQFDQQWW